MDISIDEILHLIPRHQVNLRDIYELCPDHNSLLCYTSQLVRSNHHVSICICIMTDSSGGPTEAQLEKKSYIYRNLTDVKQRIL